MTLTLELQPELELRLRREAGRKGLDARGFVLDLLQQSDEHAELIATTNRLEEANVFRVQCLAELARRRHMTLTDLMDELGIKPAIYG